MKKTTKVITVINYIVSSILWLLGVLTLLFNILGLWEAWHLAGFGFILFLPYPIIAELISIVLSLAENERKLGILNIVSLGISIAFALFTVFVSSTWF